MTPQDHTLGLLWASAAALADRRGRGQSFRARFESEVSARPAAEAVVVEDEAQLGDLLETLRDATRAGEFQALIDGSLRADGAAGVATTQRFTPGWIARWLAERSLEARDGAPSACIDPACGGGRLLLALYDAGVPPGDLYGLDIDPAAVAVSRWSLWLRAARDGREAAEATIQHVPGPLGALGNLPAQPPFGVVISNPPYMGTRHLDPATRQALRDRHGAYAGDLYTAFLHQCLALSTKGTALAILCQHSFLFVRRDRRLRQDLLSRCALREILHLGAHAFPNIDGEKASVVAFSATVGGRAARVSAVDLRDLPSPAAKQAMFEEIGGGAHRRVHDATLAHRRAQTGASFAYWLPGSALRRLDSGPFLGDVLDVAGSSHKTAENSRFVRRWWEVPPNEIGVGKPWVAYAKGGPFQRWSGNLDRVVDWSQGARDYYRQNPTSNLLPERYWYREGITWSDFGGLHFSARHLPAGAVFDMAGPALFVPPDAGGDLMFWLGLLNTNLVCQLLNGLNPTIHYQVGDLRRLPIPDQIPDAVARRVSAAALRAVSLTESVEACTKPHSPRYEEPCLLRHGGTGDCHARLARAVDWIHAQWATLDTIRAGIERDISVLYDLGEDSPMGPEPRRKLPRLLLHARDFDRGRAQGRYPAGPVGAALWGDAYDGIRSSPGGRLFPTDWHHSRLGARKK
jgi:methylase of polypeptide subunit release factors